MELNYLKLAQRLVEWAKHNCKPRLPGFCLSAAKQIQADPLNKPSAKQTHWPGIYHGNMLRATQAHGKPPPCPQDASGGAQAARPPLAAPTPPAASLGPPAGPEKTQTNPAAALTTAQTFLNPSPSPARLARKEVGKWVT